MLISACSLRPLYTQVVWAASYKVGCGYKRCAKMDVLGNTWKNVCNTVCNYQPQGNYENTTPYKDGASCSACPASHPKCDNKLCSDPNTGDNIGSAQSCGASLLLVAFSLSLSWYVLLPL